MSLGFVLSFISMVFIALGYLLFFVFKIVAGSIHSNNMNKHETNIGRLRERLSYTPSEKIDAITVMTRYVEAGAIGKYYGDEMVQIFGENWEPELRRLVSREKMHLKYNNLYKWLGYIALARDGKCGTNMLLDFDGFGPTKHNLMAVKCIEDNLRKSGLDVRLEIAKVDDTSYYARVSELEYHGIFNPPNYMWEDVVNVERCNQH